MHYTRQQQEEKSLHYEEYRTSTTIESNAHVIARQQFVTTKEHAISTSRIRLSTYWRWAYYQFLSVMFNNMDNAPN